MNETEILEEMRNLRKECRVLNADIIKLTGKNNRLSQSLDLLINENKNYMEEIAQMKKELGSYSPCDINDIKQRIDEREKEIQGFKKEYECLCKDISRLTDALQIQRESALKQEIYGQISTGYKFYQSNQINKEGSAIALKRSLEEELKGLESSEAPTRIVAKKRSQLSRIQYLCPTS